MRPSVVGVVVTYQRREELGRLLEGLARDSGPLDAVVVVDNGQEQEIRELVEANPGPSRLERVYVAAENLGAGAGWKRGTEEALERFRGKVTHVLMLDDDVIVPPGVVGALVQAMDRAGAGMAAPLISDAGGELGSLGMPEPVVRPLRKLVRNVRTRDDALRLLGSEPFEICWCIGPCVLVSTTAIAAAGMHRPDFWLLGEDIEFSLRLSAHVKCVAVPDVSVAHVPPPAPASSVTGHYRKFCALLQNLSYTAVRLRHSRHLWRYLPGNFRRFLGTFGWSLRTMADAASCFWAGAVMGEAAGGERGRRLRERIAARAGSK